MKIYLVTAPGHENTGYGDGLLEAGHVDVLVSFLEFVDAKNADSLRAFKLSDASTRPAPKPVAARRQGGLL